MSDPAPGPPRLRPVLLVADGDERRLLTAPGGRPPRLELPSAPWQRVDPIVDGARRAFGLDMRVLRALALADAPGADGAWPSVYLCALRGGAAAPPGWRWRPRREFEAAAGLLDAPLAGPPPLAAPPGRVLAAALATWRRGSRVPWYAPPFALAAEAWGAARLRERGLEPAPPVQLRSWERAAVWRYDAGGAPAAYLKAVRGPFAAEPALTAALAAGGAPVAAPLATAPERGLLLLAAAPGDELGERPAPEVWERALERYAELQIASAWRADGLRAAGAPRRPLAQLRRGLAQLPSSRWLPRAGLMDEEIAALRERLPRFEHAAAELATWRLPDALEHGDLWPAQVLAAGAGEGAATTFLDWSDASLAHPFLSLWFFLVEHATDLPGVARERLERAYLGPWEREAGRDLAGALRLATELAPLHHALLYSERILPAMAHPDEMVRMLGWFVRSALRAG